MRRTPTVSHHTLVRNFSNHPYALRQTVRQQSLLGRDTGSFDKSVRTEAPLAFEGRPDVHIIFRTTAATSESRPIGAQIAARPSIIQAIPLGDLKSNERLRREDRLPVPVTDLHTDSFPLRRVPSGGQL